MPRKRQNRLHRFRLLSALCEQSVQKKTPCACSSCDEQQPSLLEDLDPSSVTTSLNEQAGLFDQWWSTTKDHLRQRRICKFLNTLSRPVRLMAMCRIFQWYRRRAAYGRKNMAENERDAADMCSILAMTRQDLSLVHSLFPDVEEHNKTHNNWLHLLKWLRGQILCVRHAFSPNDVEWFISNFHLRATYGGLFEHFRPADLQRWKVTDAVLTNARLICCGLTYYLYEFCAHPTFLDVEWFEGLQLKDFTFDDIKIWKTKYQQNAQRTAKFTSIYVPYSVFEWCEFMIQHADDICETLRDFDFYLLVIQNTYDRWLSRKRDRVTEILRDWLPRDVVQYVVLPLVGA